VIVDALDEGRLRSGDPNFEEFLKTTWEMLLQDRSVTDRPKLVLLGRDFVVAELVDLSLQVYAPELEVAWLQLDFFDRKDATRVIEAHAAATARRHDRTWKSSAPTRDVIDGFFAAIAAALSLDSDTLWTDPQGRAFAGYAPVLAAIGSLLEGEAKNPIHLKNALAQTGVGRAWDVIVRVANAILVREHDQKVMPQLRQALGGAAPPPDEAYDAHEQLTYLVQKACGQAVLPTSRVNLRGSAAERYRGVVEKQLQDHPFLQNMELKNDVLKSVVFAHGIAHELIEDEHVEILREASKGMSKNKCSIFIGRVVALPVRVARV
jgi:hypothetical protein